MKISNKNYETFVNYLAGAPLSLSQYYDVKEIMDKFFERPVQKINDEQTLICPKCEAYNDTDRVEKCWKCGKSLALAKTLENEK